MTIPAGAARPNACVARVELPEQRARLRGGRARLRIDADAVQLRHVDHDPAVADREAGEAVAAAAHRERQTRLLREPDRRDHVVGPRAARDQRRVAVDRPVPDLAVLVVAGVAGLDQLAAEGAAQLIEGRAVELNCRHIGASLSPTFRQRQEVPCRRGKTWRRGDTKRSTPDL